jgi:hypothetical protein
LQVLAYLDPGSGSVILQAIVGGTAAVAVTAKLWWRRFTGLFRRADRKGSTEESA